MKKNRWVNWATALVAVLLLGVGALALTPQVSQAAATEHGIGGQPGARGQISDTFLAQALNITVEQLEAARVTARHAAIDQVLSQGLITQAQADALKAQENNRALQGLARLLNIDVDTIDRDTLLASALNITVEQLDAARETAKDLALAEAVESGRITQEQADLMQAREALREFLDERMQAAYTQAVQEAVAAGIITQEQADAVLSSGQGPGSGPRFQNRGFRGEPGFQGGPGRRGFPGGRGFPGQSSPEGSVTESALGL